MYIKNIELEHISGFEFSRIDAIRMRPEEAITIILGSNGAGKSTFLRNILPLYLNKKTFIPIEDGSHSIEIDHNGNIYQLDTFKEDSKLTFSFKENDKELNINGNNKQQIELLDQYLNINPITYRILTANYHISTMTIGDRKELLISTHPYNLTYVHALYKKVSSRLKERKANSKLLTSEKLDIDKKLLSDDEWVSIKKKYEEHIALREYCLLLSTSINQHIHTLQSNIQQCDIDSIDDDNIRTEQYGDINRETYLADKESTQQEYVTQLAHIAHNATERQSLLEDIEKYTAYLDNNEESSIKDLIDNKKMIETEIVNISVRIDDSTIYNQSTVVDMESNLSTIEEILADLSDLPRCTTKQYNRLGSIVSKLESDIKVLDSKRVYLQKELTECNTHRPILSIGDDCNKSKCDLYKEYANRENIRKDKENRLNKEITDIDKILHRKHKWHIRLQEEYTTYIPTYNLYMKLNQYIHNQLLADAIRKDNLIIVNPLALIRRIRDAIDVYYLHIKKEKLLIEKTVLDNRIEKWNKRGISSTKYINELLDNSRLKLHKLDIQRDDLIYNKDKLYVKLQHIEEYIQVRDKVLHKLEQIDIYVYNKEIETDIKFFTDVQRGIKQTLTELDSAIQEIKGIVDIQDQYRDRSKHITGMLDKIHTELAREQLVEAALSPVSGIPNLYLKRHINTLIANTNILISKVWSYPLKLIPITDKVDYTFSVLVEDVTVSDVSTCSDSQKAIIDLCFNIALMVQKQLTDYPMLLDEIDRPLDEYHKTELIKLFQYIIDAGLVSQLFLVNHSSIISGLPGNYVVIKGDNLTLPSVYNTTAQIEYKQ